MSSFDDIIQQKVAEHTAPVPEGAWEKIAGKKKKRRSFFWPWMLLSIALIGGGYWVISNQTSINKSLVKPSDDRLTANTTHKVESVTNVNEAAKIEADKLNQQAAKSSPSISANLNTMHVAQHAGGNDKTTAVDLKQPFHSSIHQKHGQRLKGKVQSRQQVEVNEFENAIKQQLAAQPTAKTNATPDAKEEVTRLANTEDNNAIALNDSTTQGLKITKKELGQPTPSAVESAQQAIKNNQAGKWSFGLSIAPFVVVEKQGAPYFLTRSVRQGNLQTNFVSTNIQRSYEPGFAFGLMLQRNLSSQWQIAAGLQYAQVKEHLLITGNETVTQTYPINRLDGSINGGVLVQDSVQTTSNGVRKISSINSYQLFALPIAIHWQVWQHRKWQMELNASLVFHLNSKYQSAIQPALTSSFEPTSAVGVDGNVGIRLSRMINQNWRWFIAPDLQVNLQSPKISTLLQPYPLNLAMLKFGWIYRINKK